MQDLRQQVVASEQAVQQWREANNLTAADAKGTTVSTQQLGELNTQLREVADERDALELEWLAAAEVVG